MYFPTNLNFPNLWESQLQRVEKLCQNIYHQCRRVSSGVIRCNVKEKKETEVEIDEDKDKAGDSDDASESDEPSEESEDEFAFMSKK